MSGAVDPQQILVIGILLATVLAILGTLFTLHSNRWHARAIAVVCRTLGGFILLLGPLLVAVGIAMAIAEAKARGAMPPDIEDVWDTAWGGVIFTALVSAIFGLPALLVPRLRARPTPPTRRARLDQSANPSPASRASSSDSPIERAFAPPARDEDEPDA